MPHAAATRAPLAMARSLSCLLTIASASAPARGAARLLAPETSCPKRKTRRQTRRCLPRRMPSEPLAQAADSTGREDFTGARGGFYTFRYRLLLSPTRGDLA